MATMASIHSVHQMYVAYYGRLADIGGLIFWANRFDETNDLTETFSAFGNSTEFLDKYGHLDNEALIHSLYQQMFNRNADSEGLAFYLDKLETGAASLATIAKQVIDGISHDSTDAVIFDNKITMAHCLSDGLESGHFIENPEEILDATGLNIDFSQCNMATTQHNSSSEEIILTGISTTDNSTMSFDL